jgi:Flp pilus assembly protein TadD
MIRALPMGLRLARSRHTTLSAAFALSLGVGVGAAAGLVGCAHASVTDRAQSLVRQHRETEAVAALRVELARHPDDVPARRLLVRLLGFTGDMVAARAETEELAKRLGPDDPTRYDEALEAYDSAAAAAPKSPVGPREGGMRAARWGEAEWALPRLEEAVRRGANEAETWHALGLVRLHLGDLVGADQAYRMGTVADPGAPESWLGLASVALTRGDAAGALAAYDHVLALRPHFAAGELGRAWALAKLGRRDEASRALDHAQELGAPAAQLARQRAMLQQGQAPTSPAGQGSGGVRDSE